MVHMVVKNKKKYIKMQFRVTPTYLILVFQGCIALPCTILCPMT